MKEEVKNPGNDVEYTLVKTMDKTKIKIRTKHSTVRGTKQNKLMLVSIVVFVVGKNRKFKKRGYY